MTLSTIITLIAIIALGVVAYLAKNEKLQVFLGFIIVVYIIFNLTMVRGNDAFLDITEVRAKHSIVGDMIEEFSSRKLSAIGAPIIFITMTALAWYRRRTVHSYINKVIEKV